MTVIKQVNDCRLYTDGPGQHFVSQKTNEVFGRLKISDRLLSEIRRHEMLEQSIIALLDTARSQGYAEYYETKL